MEDNLNKAFEKFTTANAPGNILTFNETEFWTVGTGAIKIKSDWEIQLDKVLDEIRATLVAKHHDYGESNLLDFGELGILIRASDKVSRLKNLIDKKAMVPEVKKDTWRDLAGYCVQCLIHFYK